jgi:exosortase K
MKPAFATLAVVALVMWGLKRYYADAPVDDLRWMLAPTADLVTAASGVSFERQDGEGYVSRTRRFVIAKACAGINFMIAAFGMVAWTLRRRAQSAGAAVIVIATGVLASYAAALLVNAARIIAALWLADHPIHFIAPSQVHRLEGITCYFAGLVLLCELVRRLDASIERRTA